MILPFPCYWLQIKYNILSLIRWLIRYCWSKVHSFVRHVRLPLPILPTTIMSMLLNEELTLQFSSFLAKIHVLIFPWYWLQIKYSLLSLIRWTCYCWSKIFGSGPYYLSSDWNEKSVQLRLLHCGAVYLDNL